MPRLRDLQRAFGACLLDAGRDAVCADVIGDGFPAAERVRIYRNTFRSTLVGALRLAYPAVDRLVGGDFFEVAAGEFVFAQAPRSGYLNEYGGGFSDFLAAFAPARSLAYLPDVARFEWALNLAANAPDTEVLRPDALAALHADDHASLCFEAHPSVHMLLLSFPADRIADAALAGDDAAMASVDLACGPVGLAVHRGPDGIEVERLGDRAYEFVSRLCAGEALGSLAGAFQAEAAQLLAEQLAKGRLSAFRVSQ